MLNIDYMKHIDECGGACFATPMNTTGMGNTMIADAPDVEVQSEAPVAKLAPLKKTSKKSKKKMWSKK